jgi:hypothetical protein
MCILCGPHGIDLPCQQTTIFGQDYMVVIFIFGIRIYCHIYKP